MLRLICAEHGIQSVAVKQSQMGSEDLSGGSGFGSMERSSRKGDQFPDGLGTGEPSETFRFASGLVHRNV